jgi:hypothetical protein
MLISDGARYERTSFENEAELEKVVEKYAEYLFGSSTVYLPQKQIKTVGGRGTVPDAIVIDAERREWFVVEAELASHGTWTHIAPQVSKQLAAVESQETRQLILKIALDEITRSPTLLAMFDELGHKQIQIHGLLEKILAKRPTVAIPIDSVPSDLEDWIRTLRHEVKIWIVEKYNSSSEHPSVLYSIPDENFPSLVTRTSGKDGTTVVRTSSQPWRDLMESGVLADGAALTMRYGQKGRTKRTFKGTARKEGVEVDGKVMSPSGAALHCINTTGADRRTVNGWMYWKNKAGVLINDLYRDAFEHGPGDGGSRQ